MRRLVAKPFVSLQSPVQDIDLERNSTAASKQLAIVMLFPCYTLSDHLPSGDGLIAYNFILQLAQRGHRITVLAQKIALRAPLPANVTLKTIASGWNIDLLDRFIYLFGSRRQVKNLLRAGRCDLVHLLNPVFAGMAIGMIGLPTPLVLGTYFAYWERDMQSHGIRKFIRGLVLRIQENAATGFLVTNDAAMNRFTSSQRVASRIHRLQNGVDTCIFKPFDPLEPVPNSILFLGRIEEEKGLFTLLSAFEHVYAEMPTATLLIAGTGPQLDEMKKHVALMTSRTQVRFLGFIDRDAIPALMANVTVYCLPSYGEPYGMSLVEAMACGKPVVVTNSGGPREIVDDHGGRRVEPRNPDEMAVALLEILQNTDLAKSMSQHNRSEVERRFSWPLIIHQLEHIYASLL